jgi:hypothetical protein
MIRFGSLVFCATLGTGLWACGGGGTSTSTKDPLELVPLDDTVPGWTVDQAHNKSPGERAMTATTQTGVGALIDGGFENYFVEPNIPKMFLWQNYVNSTLPAAPPPDGATVKLYIFEMPSADQAKGIYTGILQRIAWAGDWQPTTPALGTESRIQDTNTQWWVNFHQGVFYVEVLLGPSFGPPPDYAPGDADTKAEAVRFAQAVASQI